VFPEPDFAVEAAPEQMLARLSEQIAHAGGTLPSGHRHGDLGAAVSVRSVDHQGHQIVIRTHYEIEVDGRPFEPEATVDLGGRVHYHGLPTRDFASMVDLVRKAIDTFPADFDSPAPSRDPDQHAHHAAAASGQEVPHVRDSGEPPANPPPGRGHAQDHPGTGAGPGPAETGR
jgi:hypothetical protein